MNFINQIIDSYNIPVLTAFLLGIMTSISPCPLATNITAVAFISREIKDSKKVVLNGLMYTLGRGITYSLIAILMYLGFSAFNLQAVFQEWGDKILGPFLILTGLVMLDIIKINLKSGNKHTEKIQDWLKDKGYIGSLLLGALFALAFCPYSGVMFFGMLIPMVISTNNPLFAPLLFSVGTGLPVIVFSFIIAFSVKKLGTAFNSIKKVEVWIRKIAGIVFILGGLYYLQFLIKFIMVK
jgi:cytochrome c-type biogenesis protein